MMIRRAFYSLTSGYAVIPFSYANFINNNVVAYATYTNPYTLPQAPSIIFARSNEVAFNYPTADLVLLIEAWGRWK